MFAWRNTADYYTECIIVFGKLGLHEQSLNVLVHRLGDHTAAERYCYEHTVAQVCTRSYGQSDMQDRPVRQKLFMSLLRVYLVPEPGKKEFIPEAINLLNSHLADLDVAKVDFRWPVPSLLSGIEPCA